MKLELTYLKDALGNCADNSGASTNYCRGIIVGIVSTLCATGSPFGEALALVKQYIPANGRGPTLLPPTWPRD